MTPPRPYALRHNRGKYPPSVTTILSALSSGDGLKWWSARLTAEFAVDQPQAWGDLDRDAAVDKLRFVHDVATKAAAHRGTIIHSVNEAWANGTTVDVYDLVCGVAEKFTTWQGREEFVAADIDRYVDGLERFWRDMRPTIVGNEEVVLHDGDSHSYIGQRDFTAELAGLDGVTLVDIKTVDRDYDPSDPCDGIWMDKYRLQLSAYRKAEWLVSFDDEGRETGREKAYPIARCCVLALRRDGNYQLLEVRAAGDEVAHFYRLIDLHRWVTKGHKTPAPVERGLLLATRDEEAA